MADTSLSILISAIDEASRPLQQIQAQLEKMQAVQNTTSKLNALSDSLTKVGTKMTLFATAPIITGLGIATKNAIDFESSMADVSKVLGLTDEQTADMGQQILEMSRTLPISAEGLAAIAAAGGQLGVAQADIQEFVELTAKMATAFDMTADQAGESIAKMMNVLGADLGEVAQIGDVINRLSDTSAATSADIVNALTRVGGVTRTFGLASEEAAALAGAFIALGRPPEVAATAINSILPALQTATQGTDKFKRGLDAVGISAEDMESAIQKDAMGAVTMFFDKLGELDSMEQAKAIRDMFGSGSDSAIIASLAQDSSILAQQLNTAREAMASASNSMELEFQNRAATTANQLQLLKNNVTELSINIGSVLLPAINDFASAIMPAIQGLAEFAAENPGITRIGIAFAAVVAAIGPVLIIVGQIVGAISTLITAFSAGGALAGVGTAIAGAWATVAAVISGVFGTIMSVLTGVVAPAAALFAALMAIPYAIFSIGAAFAGVSFSFGEFVSVIKNSLMQLPANLAALPEAISVIMGAAWLAIHTTVMNIVTSIRMVFTQIATAASTPVATIQSAWSALVGFFAGIWAGILGTVTGAIASIVGAIVSGAGQAVSAVVSMGAQILGAVAGIAGQMFSAGANIVQSLAQGIMSAIGAVTSAASAVAGAIAAVVPGSPVQTGPLTVLNHGYAGNQIVEMLTGGIQAGLPQLQAMLSTGMPTPQLTPSVATAGGAGTTNFSITVNVQGGANPQETGDSIAEVVMRRLDGMQRDKTRRAYS